MSNPYYNKTGNPASGSTGSSSLMRAEFSLIGAGFDLLPTLSGNASAVLQINAGGTAIGVLSKTFSLGDDFTTSGAYNLTLTATATTSITLPATGTVSTLTGTETLTNKTVTSPAISAPAFSGTASFCSISNLTLTTPTFTSCTFSNCTFPSPVLAGTPTGTMVAQSGTGTFTFTTPTITTPTLSYPTVSSGAITLTSGQIKFNASSQGYSAGNQFAHYKEGTWTPAVKAPGTTTYTTQTGTYTRIGNMVTVHCHLVLNTVDASATKYRITGLPYQCHWNGASGSPVHFLSVPTAIVEALAWTQSASTEIYIMGVDGTGGNQYVLESGVTVAFSLSYMTLDQ